MNSNINVLVTIPFSDRQIKTLGAISSQLQITVRRARSADDIPAELWRQTDVLYTSDILPSPEQVPNLKWIQFHSAGINRHVEEPILHQPGIVATTLSGAHAPQMGEYVLMMMLALGHRLPNMLMLKEKGEWPRDREERFLPVELHGSTVGIVGYGSIGREVSRLLQPFDATILAVKWNAMEPGDSGYIQEGLGDPAGDLPRRIYPFQALKSMIAECDFLVVAVPLTAETNGLISVEELQSMKPGAFLIDVSRGGVIDHIALIRALKDKKIGGAALDVFPEEPLPKNSPLWKFPNVILSPHVAGLSPHYEQRAIALFTENLRHFLAREPLKNQFDIERQY
jgi:phosphoglycerate dehydrogenase-like enzyme